MSDTKKIARSCVNCQYWSPSNECSAPLPASFRGFLIRRKPTFFDSGKDCAAHRMKVTRKAATTTQPEGVAA